MIVKQLLLVINGLVKVHILELFFPPTSALECINEVIFIVHVTTELTRHWVLV